MLTTPNADATREAPARHLIFAEADELPCLETFDTAHLLHHGAVPSMRCHVVRTLARRADVWRRDQSWVGARRRGRTTRGPSLRVARKLARAERDRGNIEGVIEGRRLLRVVVQPDVCRTARSLVSDYSSPGNPDPMCIVRRETRLGKAAPIGQSRDDRRRWAVVEGFKARQFREVQVSRPRRLHAASRRTRAWPVRGVGPYAIPPCPRQLCRIGSDDQIPPCTPAPGATTM